jgi:hypothetical protein
VSSTTPKRTDLLPLRAALRNATAFLITTSLIDGCIDLEADADALFARARRHGLASIDSSQRHQLSRVTGEVAESVAELLLDGLGYTIFWQVTTPGVRGVDLLLLAPDERVLALEVKGTLRPGTIPGMTPSRLRQMSRTWLSDPANPGMAEWSLNADDLYAGVMVVDLVRSEYRLALSGDFERYAPVIRLGELSSLDWLDAPS